MIGLRYKPPFDYYYKHLDTDLFCIFNSNRGPLNEAEKAPLREKKLDWRVVAGDFVSTDTGTGIVHIAPAFGEDDFRVLQNNRRRWAQ